MCYDKHVKRVAGKTVSPRFLLVKRLHVEKGLAVVFFMLIYESNEFYS